VTIKCNVILFGAEEFFSDVYQTEHIKSLKFRFLRPEKGQKNIIIYIPGMNNDSTKILQDEEWIYWCKKNNYGLIGMEGISSYDDLLSGRGYCYPNSGSGKILEEEIEKIYGIETNVGIIGFSGGAIFSAAFSGQSKLKISCVVAMATSEWQENSSFGNAPAVVACGLGDGRRFQPSFEFFIKQSSQNERLAWLAYESNGHEFTKKIYPFIFSYFEGNFNGENSPVISNTSTKEIINKLNGKKGFQESWFPSKNAYDKWKEISK
jgi:hypothetical protein